MQHPLVLYTLAHAHFVESENVPDPNDVTKYQPPVGALILSVQAVSIRPLDGCRRVLVADLVTFTIGRVCIEGMD